ncbi:hypothetical protein VNO80_02752 [Phaseolus coccineus]|uniref:MI domain-containing protein n=1 Tax=Phaseolus coccineus TaxID=3886 RepID=A0AAN9RMM6_PHACN
MASSEGFLTDGQREILKIASQNVENLSSSLKSPSSLSAEHHNYHARTLSRGGKVQSTGHAARNVRRSHSGKFGRVKKDGGGAKGTRGKLLDTDGESRIDRNDPNYDSSEQPFPFVFPTAEKIYLSAPHHAELVERRWGGKTHITVDDVKKRIVDLIREYVDSGDEFEACRCILELNISYFHHEVVKRALVLAIEINLAEPRLFILVQNDERNTLY